VQQRDIVSKSGFEYLTKFCFGLGDSTAHFRISESLIDKGYFLVLYMDEVWNDVLAAKTCQDKLEMRGRGQVNFQLSTDKITRPAKVDDEGTDVDQAVDDSIIDDVKESGKLLRMSVWTRRSITQSVRPHFWFAVLVNCEDATALADPVHVDLEFRTNGESHFSEDEKGVYTWTIFCMCFCAMVAASAIQQLRKHYISRKVRQKTFSLTGNFHPVIEVFNLAAVMHWTSMMCLVIHYIAYDQNGIGWSAFSTLSTIFSEGLTVVVTSLLIVISQGWTITSDKIPNMATLLPIVGSTCVLELIGVIMQGLYEDSHDAYTSRAREGLTGLLLCANNMGTFAWFLSGVRHCLNQESRQVSSRDKFFSQFALCSTVWFLAEPVLVLVSALIADYWRHRVLMVGSLWLKTIALSLLAGIFLWPKSLYFRISSISQTELPSNLRMQ